MKKYIAPETVVVEVNTETLISISTFNKNASDDYDVLSKEETANDWDIWE